MKAFTRNSLKVTVGAAATAITLCALAAPAGAGHSPIHVDPVPVNPPTVSPARPDLVPYWVYELEGTQARVYYEVRNNGSAYAGSSMLSLRRCGTFGATFTDLVFVPGLAPGERARINLSQRVAGITADATGIIRESNEYNNYVRVPFWC